MNQRQATSRWLWGILAVALVGRILTAMVLQYQLDHVWHRQFFIPGDANGYWELGKRIAAGEEYALYDPPRRVLRMPGLPLILAGSIKLFGESFLAARLVLAVVGTLGCGAVYLLGRELLDERAGLWGAAIAACMPTFALFSVVMLSETAFTVSMLLNLWSFAVLMRMFREGKSQRQLSQWAIVCGILVGLGTYMRPNWILIGIMFPAVWWLTERRDRRTALLGLLLIAGLAVTLSPWTLRNYRVTGKFIPTTLWMGPSLYDGLNPRATGESEMTFYEQDRLLARMSEYEVDQYYRRAAWSFAWENPARAIQLAGNKFLRFWKPWPNAGDFQHPLVIIVMLLVFLALEGSALAGVWLLRNRYWILTFLLGPTVYFCLTHLFFVSSVRYRLPGEYALCLLAAAFWTHQSHEKRSTHAAVEAAA